jgi:hypothetical protein
MCGPNIEWQKHPFASISLPIIINEFSTAVAVVPSIQTPSNTLIAYKWFCHQSRHPRSKKQ